MLIEVLKKLGIGYDQLSEEEKKSWEEIESAINNVEPVTLDTIAALCDQEIQRITMALIPYDNSRDKDVYLKASLRTMMLLKTAITSPEEIRKRAIADLKQRFSIK